MTRGLAVVLSIGLSFNAGASVLQRAMMDELKRTVKELRMEGMQQPYYVAYRVEDAWESVVEGSFGAVTASDTTRSRRLFVDLRVGDYRFDNSNFVGSDFWGAAIGQSGEVLPTDEDYDALRYAIWLATDEAYKRALEMRSRKEATLENRLIGEEVPDFSRGEKTVYEEPLMAFTVDQAGLDSLVADASEVFRQFEAIQLSRVRLSARLVHRYFVDSEGSRHTCNVPGAYLEAYVATQAADGEELRDWTGFYAGTADDLPPADTLRTRLSEFALEFSEAHGAPQGEDYFGPVWLKGDACAQVFYEIVGKGASDPRRPVFADERTERYFPPDEGFLAGKLGRKVLPEAFSVHDDPTLSVRDGAYIAGSFPVDEQGVAAGRATLVEKGRLTGLLMSRTPTKDVGESNGHARSLGGPPAGRVGTLVVRSTQEEDDLQRVLVSLLPESDLEYGIVVEKLQGDMPADPWAPADPSRRYQELFSPQSKPLLSPPLRAYRLYADGHTEPVRGLEFQDVTYRTLRDVVAAGTTDVVYNFVRRGRFAGELAMSVVAPEIIVGEVELTKAETKPKKLPVVPHPYFD